VADGNLARFHPVHQLRCPSFLPDFMRKFLFLLLACLGVAACDDIIFTDGRTIAQGYVTDSLTGQPVPGAKVELFTCSSDLIAFGDRCRTILDSAVTDGNGVLPVQVPGPAPNQLRREDGRLRG
jgi:hypothetical protein